MITIWCGFCYIWDSLSHSCCSSRCHLSVFIRGPNMSGVLKNKRVFGTLQTYTNQL
jgi:hypothetical protein